eukprot:2311940-Alexandrium_andersonii.AAC.1
MPHMVWLDIRICWRARGIGWHARNRGWSAPASSAGSASERTTARNAPHPELRGPSLRLLLGPHSSSLERSKKVRM